MKGLILDVYENGFVKYTAKIMFVDGDYYVVRPATNWSGMSVRVPKDEVGFCYAVDKNGRISQP